MTTTSATQPPAQRSHAQAVEALRSSYAAVPSGETVRLAKRTSNLFRTRAAHASGLDVSGLTRVLRVDTERRTADVQGVCTYERLVAATLAHALMPRVVPQLKTITLGGAVSGLGIESTSFRNGLPHESVVEMDVLTGSGDIVTTSRSQHPDLFEAFPNSYGSLGYAVRLRVELEPVLPYVALRHVRLSSLDELVELVETVVSHRSWQAERVDFLDGVVFSPDEAYLTLGRLTDDLTGSRVRRTSDYTGQQVYYRSLQDRECDALSIHGYLWRWDTDWFWCSETFGAQQPVVRRLWPPRLRRSDVYRRIVGVEERFGIAARVDRWRGLPARERVIQDVEIPLDRTPEFLRWYDEHVDMYPVWLCPLRLRETAGPGSAQRWPLYPLEPGQTYVNVGFWGSLPIPDGSAEGDLNRSIEAEVTRCDGHKSLYSDAYYDEATFARIYGGATYQAVRQRYDPGHRLTGLYEKAVGRQ